MFVKTNILKKKVRNLCICLFNIIENNGDANHKTNGEELFIRNLFKLWKNNLLDEPVTVFDVGANKGNYTQILCDICESNNIIIGAHLFEPSVACCNELKQQFGNNENIYINQFGVSDEDRSVKLFYDQEKSGLGSIYKRNIKRYGKELKLSEDIYVRRLDKYIDDSRIKHIHFIKMDIEGHELAAMNGLGEYLNSDFIDFIQFEYGGANLDSHTSLLDIYDLLENKNFSIAKIMHDGLELRKYSSFMENFNYANYVAVSKKVLEAC